MSYSGRSGASDPRNTQADSRANVDGRWRRPGKPRTVGPVQTTSLQLTEEMRAAILSIAAHHGAREVRVFGSFARGEAGPASDLDLLVDFEPGRSLLDQVALSQDLGALLGRRVDVVTEGGLYWLLRRRILGETRPL